MRFLVHLAGEQRRASADARCHGAARDRGATPVLARASASLDRAVARTPCRRRRSESSSTRPCPGRRRSSSRASSTGRPGRRSTPSSSRPCSGSAATVRSPRARRVRDPGERPCPADRPHRCPARRPQADAPRCLGHRPDLLVGRGRDARGRGDPATLDPALADLSRRELARPAFPTSMEGEAEYAFWHALVRDVAYGALPRAARVAKHRAAAAWIAERSGGVRRSGPPRSSPSTTRRALELAIGLGAGTGRPRRHPRSATSMRCSAPPTTRWARPRSRRRCMLAGRSTWSVPTILAEWRS